MLYNNLTTNELLSLTLHEQEKDSIAYALAERLEAIETTTQELEEAFEEITSLEELAEENDHKISGHDEVLEVIGNFHKKHITGQSYVQDGGLLDLTDEVLDFCLDEMKLGAEAIDENQRLREEVEELQEQLEQYVVKRF